MIGNIACTPNCDSSSTITSAAIAGARVNIRNPASIEGRCFVSVGAVNRSGTRNRHTTNASSDIDPATKNGCR